MSYNAVGHLVGRTLQDPKSTTDCVYHYDWLSQLDKETGPATNTYIHDSLYNRLSKNATSYAYNSLHQLLNQGETTYTYDPNGNLLQKKSPSNDIKYQYDALNRLIAVTNKDLTTYYSYDPFNRRLSKKTTGGEEEIYLYHNQNEVGALTVKSPEIAPEYAQLRILGTGLGAEIGAAIALEISGKSYAPLHDHNGNCIAIVDSTSGNLAEYYRFSAFGEEQCFSSDGSPLTASEVVNPWRFSSKRYDLETETLFFGRRSYDPVVGRWLTSDPLGDLAGPNPYAYVSNNPLLAFDRYGLERDSSPGLYDRMQMEREERALEERWGRSSWEDNRDGGGSGDGTSREWESRREQHERFSRFQEVLLNLLLMPGEVLYFTGENLVPIPFLRDAVSFPGFVLAGNNYSEYVCSWHRQHSGFYYTEGKETMNTFCIQNGIVTGNSTMVGRANYAAERLNNHRVLFVHTPSHGFATDCVQWLIARCGVETNASKVTANALRYQAYYVGKTGGTAIHVAHSCGGEFTNQASYALTQDQRNHLRVRTIGSPRMIESNRFKNVINHVSEHDVVPCLSALSIGNGETNVIVHESNYYPLIDHAWEGDTYQTALKDSYEEFNKL